jgi:hypothetical protein
MKVHLTIAYNWTYDKFVKFLKTLAGKFLTFIVSLCVFILSKILKLLFSPFLFGYGCFKCIRKGRGLSEYFMDLGIIEDVYGNVLGREFWNDTLKASNGYKFGSRKDTISYAMAINKRLKTLTARGLALEKILNFFDKDHLEKTIANKKPCT